MIQKRTVKFYVPLKLLIVGVWKRSSWKRNFNENITCGLCVLKNIVKVPYCLLRCRNETALCAPFWNRNFRNTADNPESGYRYYFHLRSHGIARLFRKNGLWPCECREHARTSRVSSLLSGLQPLCSCCTNSVPCGCDCRILFSSLNGIWEEGNVKLRASVSRQLRKFISITDIAICVVY